MSDNPLHYLGYGRHHYLRHPLEYLRDWWHELRAFYQRGKYGYADRDCWNLGDCLAYWLPDAVRRIADGHSYPGVDGAATPEEWQDVLERIARGFEAWTEINDVDTDWQDKELMAKLETEYDEGIELFAKWFGHLWD